MSQANISSGVEGTQDVVLSGLSSNIHGTDFNDICPHECRQYAKESIDRYQKSLRSLDDSQPMDEHLEKRVRVITHSIIHALSNHEPMDHLEPSARFIERDASGRGDVSFVIEIDVTQDKWDKYVGKLKSEKASRREDYKNGRRSSDVSSSDGDSSDDGRPGQDGVTKTQVRLTNIRDSLIKGFSGALGKVESENKPQEIRLEVNHPKKTVSDDSWPPVTGSCFDLRTIRTCTNRPFSMEIITRWTKPGSILD